MKTSDKVLLYSTLTVVGLFILVDQLESAKYRSGDVLGYKELLQQDYTRHVLAGIQWLVVDGPIHTTIRPGDKDSLEFNVAKMAEAHIDWFRHGDTLTIVDRDGRVRDAHDNWFSFVGYPSVQVYCPPMKGIHINNGFTVLDNEANKPGQSAHFVLDSTVLWVGAYRPDWDSVYQVEPWDSISVRGVNCNFILNRQAHVKELGLMLDNRSEASDRYSTIDTGFIQGDTNTFIHLRGKNFDKVRLVKADRSAP